MNPYLCPIPLPARVFDVMWDETMPNTIKHTMRQNRDWPGDYMMAYTAYGQEYTFIRDTELCTKRRRTPSPNGRGDSLNEQQLAVAENIYRRLQSINASREGDTASYSCYHCGLTNLGESDMDSMRAFLSLVSATDHLEIG